MHHRNTEIDIGKVQLLIKILSEGTGICLLKPNPPLGTEEDLALFILHPAALRLPELRRGFWAQMKAAIQAKPGIMALLRNYILAGEETSAKHCQVIWSRVKKGKGTCRLISLHRRIDINSASSLERAVRVFVGRKAPERFDRVWQ